MDSSQEQSNPKVSDQDQNNNTQEEVEHLKIEKNVKHANDNQNKEPQHESQVQHHSEKDKQNQVKLETEQPIQILNISKDEDNSKHLDSVPQHQNNKQSNESHHENLEHDNANSQFVESLYEAIPQSQEKLEQQERVENSVVDQSQFEILDKSHTQQLNQQEIIQNEQQLDNQLHQALDVSKDEQNQQEPELIQPTLHFNQKDNTQRQVIQEEEKQVEEGEIIDETNSSLPTNNLQGSQVQSSPKIVEIDQKSQLVLQFQKSLDEATFLKNQGNQWFQLKNYARAVEQYNLSIGLCDPYYLIQCPEEQLQEFKKLRINLLSNLSACFLNLGDSNSCITHANIAIQLDPSNQKVWYRRALAYQQKQDYEEAWRDIDQAWNLVKNTTQNQEIFDKRKEIRELLKQANKERASLYQTMLSNNQDQNEAKNSTNQTKTNDSKLAASEIHQKSQINENNQLSFRFSDIIWKTTASAVLASSMTKYILEEKLDTKMGIIETLVLGSTTASCFIAEKQWQKLSFATVTAGFLAFVLYRKSTK
ncbi:unnamed protein product (macronuclear) [Paramecium tetraurelia]|uniref:Uncharacterized protein n=1 Tax=Paramecium tetraurelia TaxID=5888 RepID=A0EB21_PARTE|nr:uncharacterized protein GSPATT00025222001 [Paramecium tetraurelia]CAK92488.1 unnamed protein product [Paramecium tetraurelia]|eukprot:XP_001459885.1 hypothetical protein (macronuclear) [Paramecium tetraurelia strain d4-2]